MSMRAALLAALILLSSPAGGRAGDLVVATASDLQFAMRGVAAAYGKNHPETEISLVCGSSGNLCSQIRGGAPFDLFFSADMALPEALSREGLAAGPPRPYAIGRMVLWTRKDSGIDVGRGLAALLSPRADRIAIANPAHAPYGMRAKEALERSGLWDKVRGKLVFGENVSQAAHFARTGNARAGIISLSLASIPVMREVGSFVLLDASLHRPLVQGCVVLARARANREALSFARFAESAEARGVFEAHGFALPTP